MEAPGSAVNSQGHRLAAKLVNESLGGPFPEESLLAGSVDPDRPTNGRTYQGIYSKHHYDLCIGGTSRYHGEDTVMQIVLETALAARRFWIEGKHDSSAFEFGVATHFLLDGLICSPSVDADVHSFGDRAFAQKASDVRLPTISRADDSLYGISFLMDVVESIEDCFGETDPDHLVEACTALAQIGKAVVAPEIPMQMEADVAHSIRRLRDSLCRKRTEFADGLELAEEGIGDRTVHAAVEETSVSRRRAFLLAAAIFTEPLKHNQDECRGIEMPIVRKALADQEERYDKARGALASVLRRPEQIPGDYDGDWYCVARKNAEYVNEWASEVRNAGDELNAFWRDRRLRLNRLILLRLRQWESYWIENEVPQWWPGTHYDRIGHSVPTAMVLSVMFMVIGVGSGVMLAARWKAFWGIAVLVLSVVLFLYAFRFISKCKAVCQGIWRTMELNCPRCGASTMIEFTRKEDYVMCPVCGRHKEATGNKRGP